MNEEEVRTQYHKKCMKCIERNYIKCIKNISNTRGSIGICNALFTEYENHMNILAKDSTGRSKQ